MDSIVTSFCFDLFPCGAADGAEEVLDDFVKSLRGNKKHIIYVVVF